jgi:hypothetical protein
VPISWGVGPKPKTRTYPFGSFAPQTIENASPSWIDRSFNSGYTPRTSLSWSYRELKTIHIINGTVSTTNIPVLHSAEVVPCTHKRCYPSSKESWIPYTSTKEASQGNTTKPLESSTSFQKPATVSGKSTCKNPSSDRHCSKINPRTSLHAYSPTALAPFG